MVEKKAIKGCILDQSTILNLKTRSIFPCWSLISTRQGPRSDSRSTILLKVAHLGDLSMNFLFESALSLKNQLWKIIVVSGMRSKTVKHVTLPALTEKTIDGFWGLVSLTSSHITAWISDNWPAVEEDGVSVLSWGIAFEAKRKQHSSTVKIETGTIFLSGICITLSIHPSLVQEGCVDFLF